MAETLKAEQAGDILSFEDFVGREMGDAPGYGNFFQHFMPGIMGDRYRTAPEFKRLAEEHPDLVQRIEHSLLQATQAASHILSRKGKVNDSETTREDIERFLDVNDLYEAYRLMRSYGVADIEILR